MSKSIEAIRETLIATEAELKATRAEVARVVHLLDRANERTDAALSRASEVEAQTIERCAKECDEMARQFEPSAYDLYEDAEECRRIRQMALNLAAAIRSMRPTGDSGVQS